MFKYFKNNYPLDLALNWMLDLGGQLGELDSVFGDYRHKAFANDDEVILLKEFGTVLNTAH